jgi:hypothetical protein
VIPNIKPLDIVEEKACTTRGSTMSHTFFHMNMKYFKFPHIMLGLAL